MGVPQWRVSHLSDIPYFMNEDVAAGGDNSANQQDLSTLVCGNAAAFAYSGDPTISRGRTFKDWPIAYLDQSGQALSKDYPEELSLYVVGGPQGSGPASTSSGVLEWEKLIERCGFINSIQEEIGV